MWGLLLIMLLLLCGICKGTVYTKTVPINSRVVVVVSKFLFFLSSLQTIEIYLWVVAGTCTTLLLFISLALEIDKV